MATGNQQIVAVATRIRTDEAKQLDAFPIGDNRAAKVRVLLRYALEHPAEAAAWFQSVEGTHESGFNPAS